MTAHGWIVLGILFAVAAFLAGFIPSRRAANKKRRQVNAIREQLRNTTSSNWGPEIPGTTQVRPGIYRVNESNSLFDKKK